MATKDEKPAVKARPVEYKVTVGRPSGEDASHLQVIVNNERHLLPYDKETKVHAAVFHALDDALEPYPLKEMKDGKMTVVVAYRKRFTIAATPIA